MKSIKSSDPPLVKRAHRVHTLDRQGVKPDNVHSHESLSKQTESGPYTYCSKGVLEVYHGRHPDPSLTFQVLIGVENHPSSFRNN